MVNVRDLAVLHFESKHLSLVLAPSVGGSIARLDSVTETGLWPVLRGTGGTPMNVLEMGSFPLVPYSNRIRGGRFTFRGREVRIAANMPPDLSPLHGQGWLGAWDVVATDESSAELAFRHEPGEWHWRYEARQQFRLSDHALDVRLTCRNLSDDAMPCGLGQHPYFHCGAETRLDTQVKGAWEIDENVLPVGRVPAKHRYELRDRLVCGQSLDHGFDGWGGRATIRTPGAPFVVEMSSPEATCFQLYSPANGGIFVAEPVSHTNAALNAPEEEWPRLGLRVLEPGEEMALEMRLAILPA